MRGGGGAVSEGAEKGQMSSYKVNHRDVTYSTGDTQQLCVGPTVWVYTHV